MYIGFLLNNMSKQQFFCDFLYNQQHEVKDIVVLEIVRILKIELITQIFPIVAMETNTRRK